jgi:hypothetical protein
VISRKHVALRRQYNSRQARRDFLFDRRIGLSLSRPERFLPSLEARRYQRRSTWWRWTRGRKPNPAYMGWRGRCIGSSFRCARGFL